VRVSALALTAVVVTISSATMDERASVVAHPTRIIIDAWLIYLLPARRRENLLNALLRRTKERRELPNGYSLRFAAEGDVLSEIAHAVDNERKCCRFLRFAVTVEPDNGPITVDLTGPPGTREFLAAMLDL
jgi:hypothetical protein